ncbi:MAG: shikimate kinase [Blastopirellula sp.]|nr:MAG: shikimate kinase [Blastopirellula sp.]
MNVALIGYRGTGKSHVGRLLAERLGWILFDTDAEIETKAGVPISQIFADQGEPAFRDLEVAVVTDLAQKKQAVLSLGGGAVLREENRQAIQSTCSTIWLTAIADTILARISGDATSGDRRPSLTDQAPLQEIIALLEIREPIYRECADLIIDTENRLPESIADEIINTLDL